LNAPTQVGADISLSPIHWRYASVNWAAVKNAQLLSPERFMDRVNAGLEPLGEMFNPNWFSGLKDEPNLGIQDDQSTLLSDDLQEAFSQEYLKLIQAGVSAEEAQQMLSDPLVQDILAYQKAEAVLAAYWGGMENIPEGDYETMAMTGSMPIIDNGQLYFVGGSEANWESTLGGKKVWHKFAPARIEDGKVISGRHVILCDPNDFPKTPETLLNVRAHEQNQLTQWMYQNVLEAAEDAASIMEEYPKASEALLFASSSAVTFGPLGGLLKKGMLHAVKQVGKSAAQGEIAEAGASLLVEQGEKHFGWQPQNRERNEALLTLAFGLVDGSKNAVKNGLKKLSQMGKGKRKLDAKSPNAQYALNRKLRELHKAQKTADRIKELPDGKIRYYQKVRAAQKPGNVLGNRRVVEHDPKTGQVRSWEESIDSNGKVLRVHPKKVDGQDINAHHYPLTGQEKGE
jgi:hypothetical protein